MCYHSTKYPITTFVHMDDPISSSFMEPNANSTFIDNNIRSHTNQSVNVTSHSTVNISQEGPGLSHVSEHHQYPEDDNMDDISHTPRKPPTPTTYTIPSVTNNSKVGNYNDEEDLFGMIKLKDNDICYTSGSIEWVGRKRTYPINSGFKIINDSFRQGNEPLLKKIKRLDKTFTIESSQIKECDCADVLPTVNAIVDHLNALHEAIDLVDLRLNSLEDISEDK